MSNNCPYRSTCGKICTHKGCKTTRKSKSICIYKNEKNCPLYNEWLELKNKELSELDHELKKSYDRGSKHAGELF